MICIPGLNLIGIMIAVVIATIAICYVVFSKENESEVRL